ncbi:MAG TPA: hypothetical protein VGI77_09115 [Gaiellaceae bacterium]
MARAAVPAVAGVGGAAYLAALLALDHYASYHEQLALGVLTFAVLAGALSRVPLDVRVQTVGVVCFATVGEVTGSLLWGVYHYRLHNLPLFVPPAHGLVYLTGFALARSLGAWPPGPRLVPGTGKRASHEGRASARQASASRTRALVATAATVAAVWGLLGLTVLPHRDVAGAIGVPLLLLFLWRGRNRAIYAAVFLVVASLELYGTAIGTWRWERTLPGLGIPDGNPPSGVASGYVWFDVMALLVAPHLLRVARRSRGATDDLRAPAQSH